MEAWSVFSDQASTLLPNPASGHNPAHIMRSQVASVLLGKPLPRRLEDEETDKDASEIAHMPPKDGHLEIQRGVLCQLRNQKPAVTDKLKLIATSRMKVPRVSFFMLLPPCRGGYGCRKREVRDCDMENVHSAHMQVQSIFLSPLMLRQPANGGGLSALL